ncbi:hypothetical protein V8G54_016568 [Vigna mungo]|uniref:HTH OST-type domain-containing protein n=1 Tax=Vigna mungo TaxID=3915 RepID=A0AAQ3NPA6_VIGMU
MAIVSRLFVIPAARPVLAKTIFFMSSFSARTFEPCEPSPSPARSEEESRNVRVWAWWDFKNCHVPPDFDASKVAPAIMEAVRANGIKGPLNITAFGDVQQLRRDHQEALAYTGVRFIHVSDEGRNSADILVDLMYWVSQNPPPAHIFLISGDRNFAGTLHRLRMSNYNILLATPEKTPSVLHSAATIAWMWDSLLNGENLTGKVLNHPPDGPLGSWYGSYKEPVTVADLVTEEPVTVAAPQATSLPNVEVCPSRSTVPKSVLSKICNILSLHPKGVGIDHLRAELLKIDVRLDKNWYGHKKFSRFLLSMPGVDLRSIGDGPLRVHLVPVESMEPCKNSSLESTVSDATNEEKRCAAAPKVNGEGKSKVRDADKKLSNATNEEKRCAVASKVNGEAKSKVRDADRKLSNATNEEKRCAAASKVNGEAKSKVRDADRKLANATNEEKRCAAASKVNGEVKSEVRDADRKLSNAERSMGDYLKSVQPGPSKGRPVEENGLRKSAVACDRFVDVANAPQSETELPHEDSKDSKTKMDTLKKSSKKLTDNNTVWSQVAGMEKHTTKDNLSAGNDQSMVENNVMANYDSGNFEAKNECENRTSKEVDEVFPSLSTPIDCSEAAQKPGGSAETNKTSPTLFHWIKRWWPFGKNNEKYDDLTAHQREGVSHVEDSKLSELEQTVSQSEEVKSSELDHTVSQSEEPKLPELNQNSGHSGKPELKYDDLTAHQREGVSHVEDSKLSELVQTVSQSEEVKSSELDHTVSQSEEPKLPELNQNVGLSGKPELFSSAAFWNDMESFMFAPKGSLLFSQSRSREDVAQRLQNGGPLLLRSLPKKDILQLVDMLIADKKWLEERPSQTFPFKLTQPVHKNLSVDQSRSGNGLRSIFLRRSSQSLEHDVGKHNQSVPHTPISAAAVETKHFERSRNDILDDCQKLVNEILREHPEGYNIGAFRRLFVDKYGYHLDLQKLGYQKLVALLQIMPGVKFESTYIYPSVPAVCDSDSDTSILKTKATADNHAVSNSDSELSESTLKDDDMESEWEELGPVSIKNFDKSGLGYELVSDDDTSASEGDHSYLTQSEEQTKSICNERDSSFWETMDLWHSCKEGENGVKKSDNVDSLSVSVAHILNSSPDPAIVFPSKTSNCRDKQRSYKNYSFVVDQVLHDKDKLIGDFKKTDESMQKQSSSCCK